AGDALDGRRWNDRTSSRLGFRPFLLGCGAQEQAAKPQTADQGSFRAHSDHSSGASPKLTPARSIRACNKCVRDASVLSAYARDSDRAAAPLLAGLWAPM